MATSGMVTLRCDNHRKFLVNGLWNFLQSEHCVDLIIRRGMQSIPGHRLILDVFLSSEKLLETADHQTGHPNCEDSDINSLLEFLYSGKVIVPKKNLANLMLMARNSNFKLLVDALESANMPVNTKNARHNRTERQSNNGTLKGVGNLSDINNSQLGQMTVDPKDSQETEIGLDSDDCSGAHIGWQPSLSDTTDSESDVDVYAPNTKSKQHTGDIKKMQSRPRPKHNCGQCDYICISLHSLEIHMRQAHGITGKHKCVTCGKEYDTLHALKMHTRRHQIESGTLPEKEKPFECQLCQKTFSCTNLLVCHQRSHTGERPFICHICGKAYAAKHVLRKHLLSHEKSFQCQVCVKKFGSGQQLEYHMRTHTGEKPYVCEQCGKSFSKKFNMTKHRLTHEEDLTKRKLAQCQICGKLLSGKHVLADHVRYVHGNEQRPEPKLPASVQGDTARIYKCFPCEKEFKLYRTYAVHLYKHRVGKRFKCTDCPKTFFSKGELQIHQVVHTGLKPFKCELETCQRAFGTRSLLSRHRITHTGEKKFQCDLCLRAFVNGGNLRIHKQTVHGSYRGPFSCSVCELAFQRRSKLHKHEMTHAKIYDEEILE